MVRLARLQRAIYHLSIGGPLVERHSTDPAAALAELVKLSNSDEIAQLRAFSLPLDLDPEEAALIARGDVVGMYRCGVHGNLIRNFAATFGIDYRVRYREAGLDG